MSKELEALQDLSKLVFIYGGVEQYKIIEKSLKALEIIRERRVDTNALLESNNFSEYNLLRCNGSRLLASKDFEFLKSILENE